MGNNFPLNFNFMNNSEAIINFMYFVNNFTYIDLKNLLDSTGLGQHFMNKFDGYTHLDSGTSKLLYLFMQMSKDHQITVCNWIQENYNYKS